MTITYILSWVTKLFAKLFLQNLIKSIVKLKTFEVSNIYLK